MSSYSEINNLGLLHRLRSLGAVNTFFFAAVRISTITAFGVVLITGAAVGQSANNDKERFIGSWTLVSLTSGEGANQTLPYGPNPRGTMMVDANGRFPIAVVRSDLPKFTSNNRMSGAPEENKAVVQGSIAYWGTYSIDEATHVLTVNIEGSSFPNFTDGTQTRILSFDGDEVTYFNPTPSMGGSAKVTYRRAK
ncbi:MAG TPA: lipocalin-like domain-containing protein [Bradyrhizobium sp.]|nr:lipocalin-like domain-containing protein [Bradyrhizobium sp.]